VGWFRSVGSNCCWRGFALASLLGRRPSAARLRARFRALPIGPRCLMPQALPLAWRPRLSSRRLGRFEPYSAASTLTGAAGGVGTDWVVLPLSTTVDVSQDEQISRVRTCVLRALVIGRSSAFRFGSVGWLFPWTAKALAHRRHRPWLAEWLDRAWTHSLTHSLPPVPRMAAWLRSVAGAARLAGARLAGVLAAGASAVSTSAANGDASVAAVASRRAVRTPALWSGGSGDLFQAATRRVGPTGTNNLRLRQAGLWFEQSFGRKLFLCKRQAIGVT